MDDRLMSASIVIIAIPVIPGTVVGVVWWIVDEGNQLA